MDLTFKVDRVCSGGNHIELTVTINGTITRKLHINTNNFLSDPDIYDEIIIALLRSFIKTNTLTGLTQIKTAIEAEVFKI